MDNRKDKARNSNVISIARTRALHTRRTEAYEAQLGEIREFIDGLDLWFQSKALNLAMEGPWKEWSDEQPHGSMVAFDEEALGDCGDPLVLMLLGLYERVFELIRAIDKREGLPRGG